MNFSTYSNEFQSYPLFGDDGYRKVGTVLCATYDGKPTKLDLMANDNFKYYALSKFGERLIIVYDPIKNKNNNKPRLSKLQQGDFVNVGGHDKYFQVSLL